MHSALRTELRGTTKVFELLRSSSGRSSSPQSRSFSSRTCLRSQSTPNDGSPSGKPEGQSEDRSGKDASETPSRTFELATDVENWINKLSQNGQPLRVWDTISQRNADGKWTLLPQARDDFKNIQKENAAPNRQTPGPFGFKIENGRVKQVTPQEKDKLQETAMSTQNNSAPPFPNTSSTLEIPVKVVSKEDPSTTGLKYYGSPSARRQRAQRPKEKVTLYVLPQWFQHQNVMLLTEQSCPPQAASSLCVTSHDISGSDTLTGGYFTSNTSSTDEEGGSKTESLQVQVDPAAAETEEKAPDTKFPPQSSMRVSQEQQSNATSDMSLSAVNLIKHEVPQTPDENAQSSDKLQTHATDGSDDNPGRPSDQPSSSDIDPTVKQPIFIPLPDSRRQYYIEEAQHNELLMTVTGKMRQRSAKQNSTVPSVLLNHLLIQHTAVGAEIYLDSLIEDISKRLASDLITLDVQDIASLILSADLDPMLMNEAKDWSHEVYGEVYKDNSAPDDVTVGLIAEEVDEADDDDASAQFPAIGGEWKPIAINLKNLFGPRGQRRQSHPFFHNESMTNMPMLVGKPSDRVFSGVIDAILNSPKAKRSNQNLATDKQMDDSKQRSTIVHVKDLKSMENTNLGKQFMSQLYYQIDQNRDAGESIMLIGTEASHSDDNTYDKSTIRNMQTQNEHENYTTLVITPAHPDKTNKDFSVDKVRRRAIINARHLWEALQSKNVSIGLLPSGFWTRDFVEGLPLADQISLNEGYWSNAHIQRLSAILASDELSKSKQPIAEASATIRLSDRSKFSWAQQTKQASKKDSENPSDQTNETEQDRAARMRYAKISEKASKHEKRLLSGVIEPRKIATTFDDIHIPAETVDALKTLTTLSLMRPDAFKYGVLASDRIPGLLLYGPPGTGKTLAAKAVAKESGATMLEVSAADINDMYVGEGEKNVKALFSLAKKLSPCVVFLDEADAMFSARGKEGRRVNHRELLNQFLKEWDGMSNDSGSAFIMVATNRPMDLDDAVLRRLPRRILVDLPTEADRLEILKIHLKHEKLASDVNLTQLATKTTFYSGSDLKNVAVAAALNAVKAENELAKWNTDSEPYQYPEQRTLTAKDFDKALEDISASISEDMTSLKEIKKFDEQYGDKRGRKKKSPKWGFQSAQEADKVLDTIKVRS